MNQDSITRKIDYGNLDIYLIVIFEDRMVVRLVAKIAKEGSTLGGMLHNIIETANLVLPGDYQKLLTLWKGTSFEPVAHPYSSILDAIAVNVIDIVDNYLTDKSLKEMSDASTETV